MSTATTETEEMISNLQGLRSRQAEINRALRFIAANGEESIWFDPETQGELQEVVKAGRLAWEAINDKILELSGAQVSATRHALGAARGD
jgi:hypothetical protein